MSNLKSNYAAHKRDPSFQAVILAYKVTRPGSLLREFMVKALVQLIGTGDDTSAYSTKLTTDNVVENADLVRDMIRVTGMYNKSPDTRDVNPSSLPKCWFHVHTPGAKCAYKGDVL